jgi:large subunit ribosomal protein L22
MEVSAKAKFIKVSPRKARLVADLARGKKLSQALDELNFSGKQAKLPVMKLLKSAAANAEHNFELDKNNLLVKKIAVDEAPTLKRWMPRAHGRASQIRKRMSHISVTLSEIIDSGSKEGKKGKVEKPISLADAPKKTGKGEKINTEKKPKTEDWKKEKGKEIIDPRGEGKGKHQKIEGAQEKGIVGKVFRRKSG